MQGVSDAVLGSMCWCPITNLDSADAAYEWMMGSTRSGLSDEEQAISDALAEAGQGENELFGYGDGSGAHFDAALAAILETLGNDAAADYTNDLNMTDSVGNTAETRLNMYTPLYYLLESSEGYGTSEVAQYWRIRTGITQSDTALSTEVNLALALENYKGVEDVDFETVWGAGHTQAERTGDSTTNFIEWVNACMK